jgi:hypothetical protein
MAYLNLGKELFHKRKKLSKAHPSIQLKVMYWDLNNTSFRFAFLGINPELRFGINLPKQNKLFFSAGACYNSQLIYKRKSYEEVGWPYIWQPSFSLQFFHTIN